MPSFERANIKTYYLVKSAMSYTTNKPERKGYTYFLMEEIERRIQKGDSYIVFYLRDASFLGSLKAIIEKFSNYKTKIVMFRRTYHSTSDWQEYSADELTLKDLDSYPMTMNECDYKVPNTRFLVDVCDNACGEDFTVDHVEKQICTNDNTISVAYVNSLVKQHKRQNNVLKE